MPTMCLVKGTKTKAKPSLVYISYIYISVFLAKGVSCLLSVFQDLITKSGSPWARLFIASPISSDLLRLKSQYFPQGSTPNHPIFFGLTAGSTMSFLKYVKQKCTQ